MLEQGPSVVREFHAGPDGRRWSLTRDAATGQPLVQRTLCDGEPEIELELGSFLVLFQGQEKEELLRLIASQLLDVQPSASPVADAIGPAKFISKWLPRPKV